jgi:hypothetical protein
MSDETAVQAAVNVGSLRGKLERAMMHGSARVARETALLAMAEAIGDPMVIDLVERVISRRDDPR